MRQHRGCYQAYRYGLPEGSTWGRQTVSYRHVLVMLCTILLTALAAGQSSTTAAGNPEEVVRGGYVIHQSVDLGYRISDQTGSDAMYNTLVNQHDGPRVFEQTLSMQSEHHQGTAFDNLSVNSTGWGGDPNNYLRLRIGKDSWYDFRANFRRDQDYFDYDLLANPLNPSTSVPTVLVTSSPHAFSTRRRMSDLDITLLPKSKVSFRLGYSRNNMTGSSWTSIHEGTDTSLLQPWNTTVNAYRMGMDVKLLPHTVFSYDQFLNYYKGDTSAQLNSLGYKLAGGTGVDLGIVFNTLATSPCATPLLGTGFVNPACNGYLGYSRFNATRTSFPTERVGVRSNYLRRLDVNGSFSYTSGDVRLPVYSELFDGLTTRTRLRQSDGTGSAAANRVSANADFQTVLRVTEKLKLVDSFRFFNYRLPGAWGYTTGAVFGATLLSTPNVFDPATCPPPFTAATCPQHNASSGADLTVDHFRSLLKEDQKLNTLQLEYDFVPQLSGRIGYRFERSNIVNRFSDFQDLTFYPSLPNRGACAGLPLAGGVCTTTAADAGTDLIDVNAHSLLLGVSFRPDRKLRMNFDTDQYFADDSHTRISPRKKSEYRFSGNYSLRPWAVLSGALNVAEESNNDLLTNFRAHNRNYAVNVSLNPYQKWDWNWPTTTTMSCRMPTSVSMTRLRPE
jgi:hypothetical protein